MCRLYYFLVFIYSSLWFSSLLSRPVFFCLFIRRYSFLVFIYSLLLSSFFFFFFFFLFIHPFIVFLCFYSFLLFSGVHFFIIVFLCLSEDSGFDFLSFGTEIVLLLSVGGNSVFPMG